MLSKPAEYSSKQIYHVFFNVNESNPDLHNCKSCDRSISQKCKKGYINCVNHAQSHENWRTVMQDALAAERSETGSMLSFVTRRVSAKAQNIHDWIEWIIMDDLPFSFVENKYARKNMLNFKVCL